MVFPLIYAGVQALAQGFGAYAEGQAQEAEGEYKGRLAEANALLLDFAAADAYARGNEQAAGIESQGRVLQGAQTAAYAGQGVAINSGSAVDVMEDSARTIEKETRAVRNNAWREAWGYKQQALNMRHEGEYARLAGKTGAKLTYLTGGIKALSTIGDAVSKYDGGGDYEAPSTPKRTGRGGGGSGSANAGRLGSAPKRTREIP